MDEDDIKLSEKPKKTTSYVRKSVCVITVVVMCLISGTLLVLMIMALNGTLPAIRDMNFVPPSTISDMDKYAVVNHMTIECRKELPMRVHNVKLGPDPLIMPNGTDVSNLEMDYDLTLVADVPEDVGLDLLIQRLEPPWHKVPCHGESGSCYFPNACTIVGKMLGKESCKDLKAGNYTMTGHNQLIDLKGPFKWATPGNYLARVSIQYREQAFGCVDISFRVSHGK